jgi:uncharacterized NAD(P)/FAD-binding protein YdhS
MTVAVIGGGFSGAMTAAHLTARGIDNVVLEPGALGRGIAYAETGSDLLLNVPAGNMSARPDDKQHFARWLAARGIDATFAPRALYGAYVNDAIVDVAGKPLSTIATRATSVTMTRTGFRVAGADGTQVSAQAIVLALGNAAPRTPDVIDPSPHWLADPYRAPSQIDRDAPVALLGTGLTALDVIAGLRQRGHRGEILAVSRRGLVPRAFDASPQPAVEVPRVIVRSPRLAALLAWWKSRSLYGISDVAVIGALRPLLPTLWRRLPDVDRRRFVRHLRARWDVLRHRAPPAIASLVEQARATGSLTFSTGALVATARVGELLRCTFLTPKKTMLTRDVRYLVNCTGPERDVTRQRTPLVDSLLGSGLIERDSLGLGVCTDGMGRLIGRDGYVPRAYTVGPWRIAEQWESTAVPELREQAASTAGAIADDLSAWVRSHGQPEVSRSPSGRASASSK